METKVQRLLLQLDGDRHPSVFDAVVAYDAGAEQLLRHGAVRVQDVRALVHGCIFTRGPKDLKHTAIFIGGSDVGLAERMLAEATSSFFGPFRTSVMLDPNGSNTTAAAAVVKLIGAAGGSVKGRGALVLAGTGPVGSRAAGLLSREGARVRITSRERKHGEAVAADIARRFGGEVEVRAADDPGDFGAVFEGAELLLAAGPAGVQLADASAWQNRRGLIAAADLNAVPPLGLAGIEVADDGVERAGVKVFGAIGVGGLKMKVHKACVGRLFERNDLVLDAETIFEAAMALRSRPAVAAD
jgi:hypothetical protein